MPSASKTPTFLGSLPETEGPFLNPSKLSLTSYPQTIDEYHDYGDTSFFEAGYFGEIGWYQQTDTPLITSAILYQPSNMVIDQYNRLTSHYNHFNGLNNLYNIMREHYDD
jgi:hypothetical protein